MYSVFYKMRIVTKEGLAELISLTLQNELKQGKIEISGLEVTPLSHRGAKSANLKITDIEYHTERPMNLPSIVAVKIYGNDYRPEYRVEKEVLELSKSGELEIGYDNTIVRVFPKPYFWIPEWDENLAIVREYINGDERTLDQIADERHSQRQKLSWDDVRFAVRQIALLHLKSPWIINKVLRLPKLDLENATRNFIGGINALYMAINNRELPKNLERKFSTKFSNIAEKYFFREGYENWVVCGDLSIIPYHITNNILFDAGSVRKGPVMEDLAFYAYPGFSDIGELPKIGELAINEYLTNLGVFRELIPTSFELKESLDDLLASWGVGVLRGVLRVSNPILKYQFVCKGEEDIEMRRRKLENYLQGYLQTSFEALRFLKQHTEDSNFSDLEELFKQVGFENFKIKHLNPPRKPQIQVKENEVNLESKLSIS